VRCSATQRRRNQYLCVFSFFGALVVAAFGQQNRASDPVKPGVALVVGNASYPTSPLQFPVEDATEFGQRLTQLGFDVDVALNVSANDFRAALTTLTRRTQGRNLPIVFYFAGHGLQVNGRNYLLPIDVSFTDIHDLSKTTVALDDVFGALASANDFPKIVILDACRTNPFATTSPTEWIPGLALPVNAPSNTLIAFATDPGSVASDGVGVHSPYTRSLLHNLRKPGLTTDEIFRAVREDVEVNTDGLQTPWENTSLTKPYYFWPPIYVSFKMLDADDDLIITVNGEQVADWNLDGQATKKAKLKAGLNDVLMKVYNQRSYTGGIEGLGGHLPEGWRYAVDLFGSDSSLLQHLQDGEDRPADNGPRHGKMFTAAKFQVLVDDLTGRLQIVNADWKVWTR
jgi:hypothetical protein